jgi:hypothetical protein
MNVHKSEELGVIYMARHGETAWSRTGHRVHRGHNDTSVFSVPNCIHTFENWRIVSDGSNHSKVTARIPDHLLRIHDLVELLRADEASVHRGVAQGRILF